MWKILSSLVTKNLHIKVLSLLIAYGMWYYVSSEELIYQDMKVPIRYQNLPDDVTIAGARTEIVKVRIQAPDSIMKEISESDVDVRLDLSDTKLGLQFFRLSLDQVRVPYGVKVLEIFPATISLNLEKKVRKNVPVQPQIEGKPAPGYELKQVKATPSSVTIIGAGSEVAPIDYAMTGVISIEGKRASFNESITLDVGNPNVQITGPVKARVAVVIGEIISEKRFAGIPIRAHSCDYVARLQPSSVDVTVKGPVLLLDQLLHENILAEADLSDCRAGHTMTGVPVTVKFDNPAFSEKLEVAALEKATTAARVSSRKAD